MVISGCVVPIARHHIPRWFHSIHVAPHIRAGSRLHWGVHIRSVFFWCSFIASPTQGITARASIVSVVEEFYGETEAALRRYSGEGFVDSKWHGVGIGSQFIPQEWLCRCLGHFGGAAHIHQYE